LRKLKIIKIANAFLFFSLLTQGVSGLFIYFGVENEDFRDLVLEVHECNGFVLLALVTLHVTLFWPTIKNHYFAWRKA